MHSLQDKQAIWEELGLGFLQGCVGGNGIKLSRIICYYQAPEDEKDLGVILPIFPESCLAVISSWMCSSISLSRNSQSNLSFAKLSTPFFFCQSESHHIAGCLRASCHLFLSEAWKSVVAFDTHNFCYSSLLMSFLCVWHRFVFSRLRLTFCSRSCNRQLFLPEKPHTVYSTFSAPNSR